MAQTPGRERRPDASAPLLECVDIRKSFGLRSGGMFRFGAGIRVAAVRTICAP